MKLWYLIGLIGLVAPPTLSAQPRISIVASEPTANTPPYVWWILEQGRFGPMWYIQGSQTINLCKDVTLTWTSEPGKYYSVETGWFTEYPWVTLMPPTYSGTNTVMSYRTGTTIERHNFRVRVW